MSLELGQEQSATLLSDRALAGWEIVSVVSSMVIAEWMLASAAGVSKAIVAIPVALAFGVMLISHRVRRETLRDLGFRIDNFLQASRLLALPMIVVVILCLVIAWLIGTSISVFRWHPNRYLVIQLALGFGWGLAQQYVLQSFLNRRAMKLVGSGWLSVVLVATVFGFLHLPNLWVAAITLLAGLVWATIYQRAPNLFALAISHSLMTWVIVSTLPQTALRHLRVGFGYFT